MWSLRHGLYLLSQGKHDPALRFVMWCFQFFRRSSLRREFFKYYILFNFLFTIASAGRHLLNIPNQCDNILHATARCAEITDAINNRHLIPSTTAVITLATIICVGFLLSIFSAGLLTLCSRIQPNIQSMDTVQRMQRNSVHC